MNITYLIGAGASYNALPVLSELPSRLEVLNAQLRQIIVYSALMQNDSKKIERLASDLRWLITEIKSHQTIDTFARKLFLNTAYHNDLKKFKSLLTVYFLFEQSYPDVRNIRSESHKGIQGIIDKRYDSFIASLVSDQIDRYELNKSVKVLSWNYDSQFELAYKKFNGMPMTIDDAQNHLQIMPSRSILDNFDLDSFGILKLNGSASFYPDSRHFYDWILPLDDDSKSYFLKLADLYKKGIDDVESLQIRYAWESQERNEFYSPYAESLTNNINAISSNTDILVVIGYSFPIFNRRIDKQIIDSMTRLEKIYIQDKNPARIESLINASFNLTRANGFSLNKISLITEDNTDSFLLPPELN